jgi:hypothetical protein
MPTEGSLAEPGQGRLSSLSALTITGEKEETSDGYQALYHRRQAPAGEVRVVNAEGGNQEVRVDLDGNGEADMEILVTAANTLRAGDFIL